ncbi:cell division topological specificity factor MinE [Halothiobacillus sp. DCM-1]|uniref:cell division topological specificity factor MinE n=1 Tax=Halothiobacillus sp. DCM-1 TaxID=3112558 RepID=UPI00324E5F64
MGLLDMFRARSKPTAHLAKERLQILIAHERNQGAHGESDYLPRLKNDLLEVIRKYVVVDDRAVQVQIERHDGMDMLELNITLPEKKPSAIDKD